MGVALAFALGVLRWFTGTKIGQWCGIALVAVTALGLYTAWVEHSTRASVLANLLVKTKAESDRRGTVIADAQTKAAETVETLAEKDRAYAELQSRYDVLSAANDSRPCLDSDAVDRLQQRGQPAGPGVGKPPSRGPR